MTALLAPHQSPNMSNYSQEETRAKLSKLANAGCLLCSSVAAASLFLEAINRHGSNVDEEKIHPVTYNVFFSNDDVELPNIIMLFICELPMYP